MTDETKTALVTVPYIPAAPNLSWAIGMQMRLPVSVLDGDRLCQTPANASHAAVNQHRLIAAFTDKRPLSSRLPFPYHFVPARLRSAVAAIVARKKKTLIERADAYPRFPLDLSADFLSDLAGLPSPIGEGPTPVILSHDLDSPEGLANVARLFLDIEESVGATSSNYIVPCGWKIDHNCLTEVKRRGHEIGIHGYDHSNRTAFADRSTRLKRLEASKKVGERYGATGYRAPSLLRTRELLQDLSGYFHYDSSIPTAGGVFPVPNNGCASARPFQIEGIWELPLSMPRDGSLQFLGFSPDKILETWLSCAKAISKSGGVVVLLTHCESRFSGNARMLDVYRKFTEWIAESEQFVWSTPANVLCTDTAG